MLLCEYDDSVLVDVKPFLDELDIHGKDFERRN